ncbi:MAG: polysaccharide biosynthesis/export family protein [Rhodobacteraceae bacterium]|jgi:polysaccharide export outer membrane protein|uniref:polysaccharide biosynthesis/export family protein n=1 Tax=Albidovulum sp. TaxID=1872424 RepID=UPI001E10553A|nr:polysaccharide biosynthesis/export family protein [uncultured Defluviimonas sp.]MCB2124949.1 polysaccharide biosynthesis/export family protein [Paracoccaceae bacterium]MCC0070936.1 polysaccharide biosynthesis/export family protein [Paracoccaceae bacterium]
MFRALAGLLLAVLLVPAAWAQSGYRIQPGDVLQMEVLEDPSLNRSLLVLPDGSVSLPLVGTVQATGKSVESMRNAISAALASNFASPPTVFLSVGQLNPVTSAVNAAQAQAVAANVRPYGTVAVYAVGEFNTQGRLDIQSGTTLLQFLAETGGLTRFAATKRIQLHRPDKKTGLETVYNFNYKAIQAGAKAPVIVLRDGDVIVAPERKLFE